MKKIATAFAIVVGLTYQAQAHTRHHHHHYRHYAYHSEHRHFRSSPLDAAGDLLAGFGRALTSIALGPRPGAWCGWEMRRELGVADPKYNLARNWAGWGRASPAGIGAVVVWPHHVGRIVGQQNGQWVIQSGNDGHALRRRPRSIAGAIAIRRA